MNFSFGGYGERMVGMFRPTRLFLSVSLAGLGMALVVPVVILAARPSVAMDGFAFGPAHTAKQQAFKGFYDAHKDVYYNTDVSSKQQATAFHVNYAKALASAPLKATAPEYMVRGRAAAGQLVVFGSEPGESDYSPLWQEVFVTWKSGTKAVLLTSDNQIFALQKQGKLIVKHTSIILNAPITKVG